MIEFRSPTELVLFLDENLPSKVKEDLFFSESAREYKGKTVIDKHRESDFFIFAELRSLSFATGITKDPSNTYIPQRYLLNWTKLHDFLQSHDSLKYDQKEYALLSINEACKLLEVTRPTLYKIIREGELPTVQILSQKRIQLKDLLNYIEQHKKKL